MLATARDEAVAGPRPGAGPPEVSFGRDRGVTGWRRSFGEPGVGKSRLLSDTAPGGAGAGMSVLTTTGVQSKATFHLPACISSSARCVDG